MTSTADLLRRARALIDTPEKWSQVDTKIGDQRCMFQALEDAGAGFGREPAYVALANAAGFVRGWAEAGVWQAGHTHADVLTAFDRAIAAAEPTP